MAALSALCQTLPATKYMLVDMGVSVQSRYDALSIGNNGDVVGTLVPSMCYRSHRYGQFDLVPKGTWYNFYFPQSVNSFGWVVGIGNNILGTRGFLWTGLGNAIDLCTLLGAGYIDPKAINDQGEICGNGTYLGVDRGFRLVPIVPQKFKGTEIR